MPTSEDFLAALRSEIREAETRKVPHIDINSGQLHRKLGGYPASNHQIPLCCKAMYNEKKDGDEVLSAPPKGLGASLTIRYTLPR